MLLGILLTVHILVCIALVAVVLLQRSEGGALGMGGGPAGFMTARGAGDLLTRTTWILFTAFLVLSVALTLISGRARTSDSLAAQLKAQKINPDQLNLPPAPAAPAPTGPTPNEAAPGPLTAPTPSLGVPAPATNTTNAPTQ